MKFQVNSSNILIDIASNKNEEIKIAKGNKFLHTAIPLNEIYICIIICQCQYLKNFKDMPEQ